MTALTTYAAPLADHDERLMYGATILGDALAARHELPLTKIGRPDVPRRLDYAGELRAADGDLRAMAARLDSIYASGDIPLSCNSVCSVAIATLPVVMRHRPEAAVVWVDAHADLNTPGNSETGYLGGMALSGPTGLWETGHGAGVPLSQVILVAQRDIDGAEQVLIDSGQVTHVPAGTDLGARIRAAVAGRPIYFHLDCDVLEPGQIALDYHVPGGLALGDLREIAETLAGEHLVGAELGEFASTFTDADAPSHHDGEPNDPAPLLDALAPLIDSVTR